MLHNAPASRVRTSERAHGVHKYTDNVANVRHAVVHIDSACDTMLVICCVSGTRIYHIYARRQWRRPVAAALIAVWVTVLGCLI